MPESARPSLAIAEAKFPSLRNYRIGDDQAVDFRADFCLVLSNFGLSKNEIREHAILTDVVGVPGVYFLVMRLNDCLYKIYAGKASCLRRRLNDYTNEFQIHSPNDYKLHFFREFMLRHEPQTEFDLYFHKCTKDTYTQLETAMIKKYDPLMNQGGEGDRMLVKKAFEAYFHQSFEMKLSGWV